MVDRHIPHLTKSKYVAGLQCHLRLWKQVYTPRPYQTPEPGTPQFEGMRIGELARTVFPRGVLIENEAYDHTGALERTKALITAGYPVIFEGAFEHDNRRIRVDILKRIGEQQWALYEVKSSTSIHEEHFADAAFQTDVLRRSGINVVSVSIMHVDRDYRRGTDSIDVSKFFRVVDVSDQLGEQYEKLKPNLASMIGILENTDPPKVMPGLQCRRPRTCEFFDQCAAALPKDWVGRLPRVRQAQLDGLAKIGVSSMSDIPDDLKLRGLQAKVRAAHSTSVPFVSATIRDELRPLGPPALYLDFESMMPGIPLYAGTVPYQHIPFLFSLHRDRGGMPTHTDYIAPPGHDPRRVFAAELIRQTASADDPIVVYSPYEKRIINQLACDLPDLAAALEKIIARLQDLHRIVRKTVYLPDFNGSFSIKDVGPALARNVSYADLNIKDGSTAAARYQRLAERRETPSPETELAMADMRAYCKRDTLAMLRVHQALVALAAIRETKMEDDDRFI